MIDPATPQTFYIKTPLTDSSRAEKTSSFEYEVGPHTLLICSHPMMKPSSDGPSLALEVEDFDETMAHLKRHNVTFLGEPFQSPICRGAFILDPDGNKIGIHKRNA